MNLEVFSLCDAATNDRGKLNMLGAFDTIVAEVLPAVHPQCTVAVRIRFGRDESGAHQFTVNLIDIDGKHIMQPVNGNININIPEGQGTAACSLILNIQKLTIPKYGEYSIGLAIDGQEIASLPLYVMQRR